MVDITKVAHEMQEIARQRGQQWTQKRGYSGACVHLGQDLSVDRLVLHQLWLYE